ncbi:MAG: hypothetical protein LBJ02_04985 [Bifidobacteriaceae bacterium]|jgi:hypothetical protein|nr:hypothetical protein [Bifidobacteriaceae bacterium]
MIKTNQRVRRAVLVLGLALAMAAAMGGCVRANVEMTFHPNNTVSIVAIVAMQDVDARILTEGSTVTPEELLAQVLKPTVDELAADLGATVSDYAADGYTGWKVTDSAVSLKEFMSANGELNNLEMARQGDSFILSGVIDLRAQEPSAEEVNSVPQGVRMIEEDMDLRIIARFPGEVKSSSGEIDGSTTTFKLTLDEPTQIEAVASATPPLGTPLAILGVAVAAIALAAGLSILALSLRKRRDARRMAERAAAYGGAPSAAGYVSAQRGPTYGSGYVSAPGGSAYGFGPVSAPGAAPQGPPLANPLGYPAAPAYTAPAAGGPAGGPYGAGGLGVPPYGQGQGLPPLTGFAPPEAGPEEAKLPPPLSQPRARPGEPLPPAPGDGPVPGLGQIGPVDPSQSWPPPGV